VAAFVFEAGVEDEVVIQVFPKYRLNNRRRAALKRQKLYKIKPREYELQAEFYFKGGSRKRSAAIQFEEAGPNDSRWSAWGRFCPFATLSAKDRCLRIALKNSA
jgi:hypothetical protein